MPFLNDLLVKQHDANSWELLSDLIYEGESERFVVPEGYVTDFASVPESLVWLDNKTGPYTRAAIVHDWLITHEIPARRVTSRDTDGIFRRIMREEGVVLVVRWEMWAAVRLGALASKSRAYERGFIKDLPKLLPMFVLAIPLAPATILVALTRLLIRPFRKLR